MSTVVILDQELDNMSNLCTYISQLVTRIRLNSQDEIPISSNLIQLYQQELLSMSENIEGSLVLLETLLISSKHRYAYTRDELLKRRTFVSIHLSQQIKNVLKQKIDYESQSCQTIRTIFIE